MQRMRLDDRTSVAERETPLEPLLESKVFAKKEKHQKMSCKVCNRAAVEEGFCEWHLLAYRNLTDRFPVWQKAMEITWKDYLSQIAENSSAGNWVKEVAKYLLENGENMNVGKS